jgi:uncharacterized DUF497 family protein
MTEFAWTELAWNAAKNAANRKKHGISFETAARIFEDPAAVCYADRFENGEQRWHKIGLAGGIAIVLVVHAVTEENGNTIIRIISARKADRRERNLYEAAHD